jgi:hypothetical protein
MRKHNAIKIAVLETLVMTDKSNEVCEALPAQRMTEKQNVASACSFYRTNHRGTRFVYSSYALVNLVRKKNSSGRTNAKCSQMRKAIELHTLASTPVENVTPKFRQTSPRYMGLRLIR